MTRRHWGRCAFVLACLGSVLVAASLGLHFTIRDRSLHLSPLYYGTPWSVLAMLAGGLGAYWWRHGQRLVALLHAVLAFGAAATWLTHDWMWREPARGHGELRVVHWNVGRPTSQLPAVAQLLRNADADIIAVSEREPKKKKLVSRWCEQFPDYVPVAQGGELLCLIRGELLSRKVVLNYNGSYGMVMKTRIRGKELTVLQVDVTGNPRSYRGADLRRLAEVATELRDEPLLIVGDFNTPRESYYLANWGPRFTDAFTAVGSGNSATWPVFLPVHQLDYLWTSPRLRPVRCEYFSSRHSDHRGVIAEFDFAP